MTSLHQPLDFQAWLRDPGPHFSVSCIKIVLPLAVKSDYLPGGGCLHPCGLPRTSLSSPLSLPRWKSKSCRKTLSLPLSLSLQSVSGPVPDGGSWETVGSHLISSYFICPDFFHEHPKPRFSEEHHLPLSLLCFSDNQTQEPWFQVNPSPMNPENSGPRSHTRLQLFLPEPLSKLTL